MLHECLKSSLAFRKPATAVASRRPARADGLMVGLDSGMQASAPGELRGAMARLGYLCAEARRRKGNVCRRRRQNDAACTALSAADQPIVDGGTQYHRLSAAVNNPIHAPWRLRSSGRYRVQAA